MKRYLIFDNKTGVSGSYTTFQWGLAWGIVFVSGIVIGILLSQWWITFSYSE